MSPSPHAAEAGLGTPENDDTRGQAGVGADQGTGDSADATTAPQFDQDRAATPTVVEEAAGAIAAQHVVDAAGPPDLAWLRVAELAGLYGWKSAAVRAFVLELAKRAGCRGA